MLRQKSGYSLFSLAAGASLFVAPILVAGQTASADVPTAKTYAFDIVSFRQNKAGGQQTPNFGPTTDGYHANALPILATILRAYVPLTNQQGYYTMDRIKGAPDWVTADRYNIDAKVSDADLAEWQKPDSQKVMLPSMLQTFLADRTKLQVHRETKESTVFNLVPGKGGVKFKETAPDAAVPAGISLPAGGTLVPGNGRTLKFYGATMASLAQVLSNFVGYPVQDKTGLTGKYDFELEREEQPDGAPPNPGPPAYAVDALGLHLDKSKSVVDTLVIDHIERPTEN